MERGEKQEKKKKKERSKEVEGKKRKAEVSVWFEERGPIASG